MYIHIKKLMTYILLLIAIIIFIYVCVFGTNGLRKLYYLERENSKMAQEVLRHEQLIQALQLKIDEWEHADFLKEKSAREQLHMSAKDDVVYYIEKTDQKPEGHL